MMDERNDRLLLRKPLTDDTGIGLRPWEEAPPRIETLLGSIEEDQEHAHTCQIVSPFINQYYPDEKPKMQDPLPKNHNTAVVSNGCPGKSRRLYKDILRISESPENSETVAAKLFVNITGVVGFLILPPPPFPIPPISGRRTPFLLQGLPNSPCLGGGRKFQSEKHVIWGMRAEALRFSLSVTCSSSSEEDRLLADDLIRS
ncbi:hypothetical protein CEXT_169801 [Caerostris extrusa]|uniref:Uncharacterized protein n=1 Tax=Caerostris extrusa TaxID=172846 RepID=A0AAV4UMX6_CAEEX|nr:hypothetical protein CEXT_169801 [Caerostris extrusa]